MEKLLIGIDFGTSTNFVTKYSFKKKEAIPVANIGKHGRSNIIPNCLYIESEKNHVIGNEKKITRDPKNFFYDIKKYVDDDEWIQKVPNLNNREITAQDMVQMIFKVIKDKIESNENRDIDGVVITVPYEYSEKYRKRIKDAASAAGLKVLKLLEEPVAAALAYGILHENISKDSNEKILVFDLGGGTFDISLFKINRKGDEKLKLEVLNTGGKKELGGTLIDKLLVEKLKEQNNINTTKYDIELEKIAKELKEDLSEEEEEEVIEYIGKGEEVYELDCIVTRDEFEKLLLKNNILKDIECALSQTLEEVKMLPTSIDKIILSGGTSNIPIVKQLVTDFFGKKPEAVENLGELVGKGAGILAGLTEDKSFDYEIIRKSNRHIGINKNKKFFKILDKNLKYNEETPKVTLKLPFLDTLKSRVPAYLYEGEENQIDIERATRIGKILITPKEYKSRIIKISLSKNDDGRILYTLYNKENEIKDSGYMEE